MSFINKAVIVSQLSLCTSAQNHSFQCTWNSVGL